MKGLVLAGGAGTRLRPISHSMPKQLVPVANKPVLVHCLENLADIGVADIGVIVGDRGAEIRAVVGDGSRWGVRVTYIQQDRALGLAHAVLIARDFLGDDDFVMYLGDNILAGGLAHLATAFAERAPAAQVVVTPVPDPTQFGVAVVDGTGRVTRLVEKPRRPEGDLAVIGVYFFTPAVHEAVRAIKPSGRGELEITDALQWLVAEGRHVHAERFGGYWRDTGQIDDVLECNRVLLGRLTGRIDGAVDSDSVLTGVVVVEPGAKIVRSRIEGPVIIGADTLVEDSRVGPHTSLGRGCVLRGAGLDSSIVLNDVSVLGVRGISGSLIGRSAQVSRVAEEPHRHRLVIGDDTKVEVPG
ncbi:glucose-1-phosphate thymidylyltransferase [Longispora fulva]|uniref:Glucose-1-phosphate thymidylyltransferase n=1 Tax=Longispora fulva TaxID=619741 RepID=A0A8J7GEC7_9ACTN|nr:glucose-1-phosphate thymidylyltransferase [Longispora fulva]MBG6134198.1 glucose-1-phosphate thymidylyltransferase [Longispora fulva]GIG63090.1 glucose-1-phosphate thymidylyltransferase [Longispora fulva]